MKTRMGFVSNSSSSSYCIVGVAANKEVLGALKVQVNGEDLTLDDLDLSEFLEYLEMPGLGYTHMGDREYAIGLHPWNDLGENETKAQFTARVEEALKKLTGLNLKAEYYEGEYYS